MSWVLDLIDYWDYVHTFLHIYIFDKLIAFTIRIIENSTIHCGKCQSYLPYTPKLKLQDMSKYSCMREMSRRFLGFWSYTTIKKFPSPPVYLREIRRPSKNTSIRVLGGVQKAVGRAGGQEKVWVFAKFVGWGVAKLKRSDSNTKQRFSSYLSQ